MQAFEHLVEEQQNWSQDRDGPFPMDVEAVNRMSNLLEPFARLAERMGLWTTALTPAGASAPPRRSPGPDP